MKKLIILVVIMTVLISAATVITIDGLYLNFRNRDTNKTAQVYYSGDSIYTKISNDSIYLLSSRLQMGSMHLDAPDTTQCTTAGVYYKIYKLGGFSNGQNNNFTIDGNGKITFVGIKGTNAIGIGASDLTADKSALITYALYKNGSLVTSAESPVDINNQGKTKNVSITRMVNNLKSGDYFEIYCKSDQVNTTVTHNTLFFSFIGDR